jgi:hypothetical protein
MDYIAPEHPRPALITIDVQRDTLTSMRCTASSARRRDKTSRLARMRFKIVVLVLSAIASTDSYAQTSAGSNRALSSTTVAYWQQQDNGDGTGSLDLLVLWRGTPGWFARGGSSGGGGAHGGFGQWQGTRWMTYGDVTLTMEFTSKSKDFDPASTVVKILDLEIPLRDTNVILIDGADSGMPIIVGTRYIGPRFTGADAVAATVKRTPELFEFVRCDVTLPDAAIQAMMALICGQMRP